jgi:hypothetical protein
MALKELKKSPAQSAKQESPKKEERVQKFIAKGGTLAQTFDQDADDHRLTLRIPKSLMEKVDEKRKLRVGKISRNLMILEILQKATQK